MREPESDAERQVDGERGEAAKGRPDAPGGLVPDPPDGERLGALLAEIHREDRSAAQILGLLSFLGDAPVPAWLLAEHPDTLPDPLSGRARAGQDSVLASARSLAERDLAAVADRALRIPVDLAAAVRRRMSVREQGEFGSTAASLVFRAFPDRVGRPETEAPARALAPHVLAAAEHAGGGGRATAEAVHALARLGAFHRSDGRPERAEATLRRALRLSEEGAAVSGALRAVLADELASVLAGLERPEEAARLAERAAELAREHVGADSPRLPLLLSNVATTFREVGEMDRAARCFRRALKLAAEADVDAARPLEAELAAGLADVELARERWGAAAGAAGRARDAARQAWGDPHPQTVRALWMLGDARRGQGRAEDATRLFRRALDDERQLHGEDHPSVGQKALALGRHLETLGRHEGAREAYRRAARAFEASLGPDADPARAARSHLDGLAEGG